MDFRETWVCKVISALALFFFTFTYAGGREVAYAASAKDNPAASAQAMPKAPKSDAALMDETLSNLRDKLKSDKLTPREAQSIAAAGALDLAHYDAAMREEFKATEKRLKDKKMPEAIRSRHKDFVKHYQDNYEATIANLQNLSLAMLDDAVEKHRKATVAHLDKAHPAKKRIALDPKKLPHRSVEERKSKTKKYVPEVRQPFILTPIQKGMLDIKPIQLSMNLSGDNGDMAGLLAGAEGYMQVALVTPIKNDPPTSADLAEAPEIKFTDAIKAKAKELKKDPRLIYQYVRNNVEFVPTYGSIQGADYCMQTMKCNAVDTASLLIALLRASGVHARYATGTIEMPIDRFMNWMGGFTSSTAALDFAASGGISVTGLRQDGLIKYVRMEHVWVMAYVDMIPSFGAVHKAGDTWMPLDGSYKQYTYTTGMDIAKEVPFDGAGLTNSILESATINEVEGWVTGLDTSIINSAMSEYQARVSGYMNTKHPNATVGDVLGTKTIKAEKMSILPMGHPYKFLRDYAFTRVAKLPDSVRHKVRIRLKGKSDIETTINLSELSGHRISLKYMPVSDADRQLMEGSYSNGEMHIDTYLIILNAEVKVDDTVVLKGQAETMGNGNVLEVSLISPWSVDLVSHLVTVGDYTVLSINSGTTLSQASTRTKSQLEGDSVSENLHRTILGYWIELDAIMYGISNKFDVMFSRYPSEGIVYAKLDTHETYGVSYSGSYARVGLDIKGDRVVVTSLRGRNDEKVLFNVATGMFGSMLEGEIFRQIFGITEERAVSSMKIIDEALAQGRKMFMLKKDNTTELISQVTSDQAMTDDILSSVNSGMNVIVPFGEFEIGGWAGTGYIAIDPQTGAGAYMISGGTAGGACTAAYRASVPNPDGAYLEGIINYTNEWLAKNGAVFSFEVKACEGECKSRQENSSISMRGIWGLIANGSESEKVTARVFDYIMSLFVSEAEANTAVIELCIATFIFFAIIMAKSVSITKSEVRYDNEQRKYTFFRHHCSCSKLTFMHEQRSMPPSDEDGTYGAGVYLSRDFTLYPPQDRNKIATLYQMLYKNTETYLDFEIDTSWLTGYIVVPWIDVREFEGVKYMVTEWLQPGFSGIDLKDSRVGSISWQWSQCELSAPWPK